MLLANGLTAFGFNIASLEVSKIFGALTMTVCGNVKQVLTIMLGIVVFSVPIGMLGAIGIAITMLGAAWYSKVELDCKKGTGTRHEVYRCRDWLPVEMRTWMERKEARRRYEGEL